jgi:hypothetical protein
MAKHYDIEIKDGVIAVRFKQNPVASDICASLDDVAKINPCNLRMWDYTCGAKLNREDIQITAKHARSIPMPSGRVAIVASDDLTFGLFRMYEAYREDDEVKLCVFRTKEEAIKWLKGNHSASGTSNQ